MELLLQRAQVLVELGLARAPDGLARFLYRLQQFRVQVRAVEQAAKRGFLRFIPRVHLEQVGVGTGIGNGPLDVAQGLRCRG
jgi:hypothetical protein